MAASQAAVAARQRALMKEALNSAARLAAAETAYQQGDIRVANRMFASVARSRPTTSFTLTARKRLVQLSDEALQKLKDVDEQLAKEASAFSTSEKMGFDGPLPPLWKKTVTVAFADYEQLCEQYESVRSIRGQLKTHVAQKRRRPEHAAVLNEANAAALCEVARQHERDQQACCAYWAYKEAAQLAPAPAARLAAEQLARMEQDPQLLTSAEACRQLQQCHALYNRAESLVKTWPSRALELHSQIIEAAPPDSEIYRAAEKRIRTITGTDIPSGAVQDGAGIDK